jgi:hypothetical protein
LNRMESVEERHETEPTKNQAGAMTARLWRLGKDKDGLLHTFEAVAGTHEVYVLIVAGGRGSIDPASVKIVDELLKQVSVELLG